MLSYCACVNILAGNAAKARSITSSTLNEIMETQERHSRVKAMKEVFRKKTYSLRQELQMETDALNSMLFSGGLISEAVLAKKDIDATLSAIRRALEDGSIAEKTFHGFTRSVSDIASKSHLARELENALADELLKEGLIPPTGSLSHQSGRDLLSPSVDQLLQQGPKRSQRSFRIYEVETMDVTPAAGQPGPADESLSLIGPASSSGQSEFELVETKKISEQILQEKVECDKMLLAKTSEVIEKEKQIEHLLHSRQQEQRNQYKLHRQYVQSIVDKSKQADERVRNAEDMARVAEKKLTKAREEVELARKAEEDVRLLLNKAEEKTKVKSIELEKAEEEAELAKQKLKQENRMYRHQANAYKLRAQKLSQEHQTTATKLKQENRMHKNEATAYKVRYQKTKQRLEQENRVCKNEAEAYKRRCQKLAGAKKELEQKLNEQEVQRVQRLSFNDERRIMKRSLSEPAAADAGDKETGVMSRTFQGEFSMDSNSNTELTLTPSYYQVKRRRHAHALLKDN